jgi:ABC-type Mn2+/Zn2+ transport system ATPase subunit
MSQGAATQGMPTLLHACGLVVGRDAPLLRDVNWELRAGECWFLLGANGAGKSTLLLTLLGLLPPLGGRVVMAEGVRTRRSVGYVPQQGAAALALPMTAREYVELGLCDLPLPRREAAQRAEEGLARMALSAESARRLDRMSLGQRRRVSVARALARRRELLILDEPTANLDPEAAGQLAVDLDRLRREDGMCVLHCSHDLWLAERFATHVARIGGGVLSARAAEREAVR